jgi:DNA-binding IclR family transcriptional regulator
MIDELASLLKLFESATRPLTARKIAERTETYQATAKRRVEALQAELKLRGDKKQIKRTHYREGKRGPASLAWYLERG